MRVEHDEIVVERKAYLANDTMTVGADAAFTTAGTVPVWMRTEDGRVTHVVSRMVSRVEIDLKV